MRGARHVGNVGVQSFRDAKGPNFRVRLQARQIASYDLRQAEQRLTTIAHARQSLLRFSEVRCAKPSGLVACGGRQPIRLSSTDLRELMLKIARNLASSIATVRTQEQGAAQIESFVKSRGELTQTI